MSKGGGGSSIDPGSLVQQQAEANRINQFSPFGTSLFSGPDRSDLTISFTPEGQRIQARQNQIGELLLGQAAGVANTPLSFEGLPSFITGVDPTGVQDNDVTRAIFESGSSLVSPIFEQQRDQLLTNLTNRGLPVGSEAFDTSIANLDRSQGETLNRLALNATTSGADLLFRNAALQNAGRTQGIAEILARRQQPFSELNQLGGAPSPQVPFFVSPNAIDVTGPFAAQAQANAANAANRQSGVNSLLGVGGTLAAAAIL